MLQKAIRVYRDGTAVWYNSLVYKDEHCQNKKSPEKLAMTSRFMQESPLRLAMREPSCVLEFRGRDSRDDNAKRLIT